MLLRGEACFFIIGNSLIYDIFPLLSVDSKSCALRVVKITSIKEFVLVYFSSTS